MKKLKIKIIKNNHASGLETLTNEFLSTLDPEMIFQINYLQSSSSGDHGHVAIFTAVITYYEF